MFIDDILSNRQNIAYICDKDILTYDDLHNYSLRLADYLSDEGTSPVLVYGHKSSMMIICFLACLISKRAYIPCDISIPQKRIKEIIEISSAKTILCTEKLNTEGIKKLDKTQIGTICTTQKEYQFHSHNIDMDSIAYIIFTSGSTGKPKGVKITYSNLENFINWFTNIDTLKKTNPKVILNQAMFSFDLSVADIYYSLTKGVTLYATSRAVQQDYNRLFSALKNSNAQMAVMTPSFAQLCLCDKTFNKRLLPFLKIIFFCGEILNPLTVKKLFKRFPDLHVINAYGPTEATCSVSSVEITRDMLEYNKLPIGKINSLAVDIKIVDDNNNVLPDGQKGQILLCGKSVSNGYIKTENRCFVLSYKGQMYYTGDIGYIDNDYLYFISRKDDMIKYKGYRIELSDIENNLCKISGVKNAVVLTNFDINKKVKSLTAYVICEKSHNKKTIKEELKQYLPDYMIPKSFYFIYNMPINLNGKIDKSELVKGVNL